MYLSVFDRRRWRLARSRAAVAVVLRPGREGDEVLLTERARRRGDRWSGHVSFPGGRSEPGDADAIATAVRETREELALDLAGCEVGRLSAHLTLEPHSRWPMAIDPVLFRVVGDPELRPNVEVAEAFWVPLPALFSGRHDARRPWRLGRVTLSMPAWRWRRWVIWGLTYGMLRELQRRGDPS